MVFCPHEDSVHLTVFLSEFPHVVARLVEALRHKPDSRRFNSFHPYYAPWVDSDCNRN